MLHADPFDPTRSWFGGFALRNVEENEREAAALVGTRCCRAARNARGMFLIRFRSCSIAARACDFPTPARSFQGRNITLRSSSPPYPPSHGPVDVHTRPHDTPFKQLGGGCAYLKGSSRHRSPSFPAPGLGGQRHTCQRQTRRRARVFEHNYYHYCCWRTPVPPPRSTHYRRLFVGGEQIKRTR